MFGTQLRDTLYITEVGETAFLNIFNWLVTSEKITHTDITLYGLK
jgi:hypothetical protein